MSYRSFREDPRVGKIAALLSDSETLRRMEDLSARGIPAVGAIDEPLAGVVTLTSTEKQHVGRWICEVLADRGWQPRPRGQRRLTNGKIFKSGMVYVRRPSPTGARHNVMLPAADRVRRAQELVRAHSTNDYGVDDFLRDKAIEAERERSRYP